MNKSQFLCFAIWLILNTIGQSFSSSYSDSTNKLLPSFSDDSNKNNDIHVRSPYNKNGSNGFEEMANSRNKRNVLGYITLQDQIDLLKEDDKKMQTKIRDIEEKLVITQQWYEGQATNIELKFLTEANKSKIDFEEKLKHVEESILDQIPRSNRIKDGHLQCRLWPGGKVPFEIDSSLNKSNRITIEEAIDDFHAKTCIRWIPRTSEKAFVNFVKENSDQNNKTNECYTGGRRFAIVTEEFTRKKVLRQMAYILGFGDENLRKDRDDNIEVRQDNCTMEDKYPHLNGGGFYDHHSIMHPSCDDSSCLKRKDQPSWSCATPSSLSVLDIEKLNEMYNCKGCHALRFQFPNQIGFNESELVPVFEKAHLNSNYICRVVHEGYVIIARGNVKTGECHYEFFGGRYTETRNSQFLTNPQQTNIQWMRRGNDFPTNAIPGGSDSDGIAHYIVRCPEEPQWKSVVPYVRVYNITTAMLMHKRNSGYICSSFDLLTCS